ncbi:hypothetical protein Q1695_011532 [Nippostrongylus brasiliensis]|nr:hypothetical protein Q1695_011532 [Nippostrongylus brasiliensis]
MRNKSSKRGEQRPTTKRSPHPNEGALQQPQPKRQRTQHDRSIDEALDDVFWERIFNNLGCDWTSVVRTLEHLGTQWTEHKKAANRLIAQWRAKERDGQKAGSPSQKQKDVKGLLRAAQRHQEMLARFASRYVAVTLINADKAKAANVSQQKFEQKVREALSDLRHERRSLSIAMEDMEAYLNDTQQQDHQREEQMNCENQLLHDQINRLRTQQQRMQEDVLEVENSRDHWQQRAQECSDENATLRRQIDQLERTQRDLEQQVQRLQRQLEQRRADPQPRGDLPRNQQAEG